MFRITEDCVPLITDLLHDMRDESPTFGMYPADHSHVERNLLAMLQSPLSIMLTDDLANPHCVMLGYIGQPWYAPVTEAYEMVLYIDEAFRGGMKAARLVKAFCTEARDKGAHCVLVGASAGISDERALGLYRALGFKPFGHGLRKELNV